MCQVCCNIGIICTAVEYYFSTRSWICCISKLSYSSGSNRLYVRQSKNKFTPDIHKALMKRKYTADICVVPDIRTKYEDALGLQYMHMLLQMLIL